MAKQNSKNGKSGAPAGAPVPTQETSTEKKGIEKKIQEVFEANPAIDELWHDGEDVYLNCRYANCEKITR